MCLLPFSEQAFVLHFADEVESCYDYFFGFFGVGADETKRKVMELFGVRPQCFLIGLERLSFLKKWMKL